MTNETFERLLSSVWVQDVAGYESYGSGVFIEGMKREELAELVTLAGHQLEAISKKAIVNPEWLALGPERNVHYVTHRETPVVREEYP